MRNRLFASQTVSYSKIGDNKKLRGLGEPNSWETCAPKGIIKGLPEDRFANFTKREDRLKNAEYGKAIVAHDDEYHWKNKLMFSYDFVKAPKHLSWQDFGKEVECLECTISPDFDRPEQIYHVKFFFKNRANNEAECIFDASNDVSLGEGLSDLLASIGTCLTRAEVHRTVRFYSGPMKWREMNIQKTSRYTSQVTIAFRPWCNKVKTLGEKNRISAQRRKENIKYALAKFHSFRNSQANLDQEKKVVPSYKKFPSRKPADIARQSLNPWGYHDALLDHENIEKDPVGTYHLTISSHALACAVIRALEVLIQQPLKLFYRPSQHFHSQKLSSYESTGISHAVQGWLGFEDKVYPHYTPLEAIQGNWFGQDAPFHVTALFCKIRELAGLKKRNPETLSWLSVRYADSVVALRNAVAKLEGVGRSRLFNPTSYSASVNSMLPKDHRRELRTRMSLSGFLGFPDIPSSFPQQPSREKLSSGHKPSSK